MFECSLISITIKQSKGSEKKSFSTQESFRLAGSSAIVLEAFTRLLMANIMGVLLRISPLQALRYDQYQRSVKKYI